MYVFILFSNNRAMEKFDLRCKEQENCLKVRQYLCNRSLFLSPSLPHMSRHSGHLHHDSCLPIPYVSVLVIVGIWPDLDYFVPGFRLDRTLLKRRLTAVS